MKKLKLLIGTAVMVTGVLLAISSTGTAGIDNQQISSNTEFQCMKNLFPCPQDGVLKVVCCTYRTGSAPNYLTNYRYKYIPVTIDEAVDPATITD